MVRCYFPDVHMRLDDGRYFVPIHVAGVSYRQDAVSRCFEEQSITLVRDPNNPHDKNAVMVFAEGEHVGFIPRDMNEGFAEYIDSGRYLDAEIHKIIGGTSDKPTTGIIIALYLPDDVSIEFDDC